MLCFVKIAVNHKEPIAGTFEYIGVPASSSDGGRRVTYNHHPPEVVSSRAAPKARAFIRPRSQAPERQELWPVWYHPHRVVPMRSGPSNKFPRHR